MKNLFSILLLVGLITTASTVSSQDASTETGAENTYELEDAYGVREKHRMQEYEYENLTGAFPSKRKNDWGLGIHAGIPFILGDVHPTTGYAGGINIQKGIGHVFAIRLQGLGSVARGLDFVTNDDFAANSVVNNYRTTMFEGSVQGIFNLNNFNHYKRQPKVLIYALAGVGASFWKSSINRTNDGAAYDFSNITPVTNYAERRQAIADARDHLDDSYEVDVAVDSQRLQAGDYSIHPSLMAGIGFNFRLHRRVDLTIEHRMSYHNSDLLDAHTESVRPNKGNGGDIYNYSSVGLMFKLGKHKEALWWQNPNEVIYEDVRNLKEKINGGLFADEDEDGIVDVLDQELNTPPNAIVNSHGVTVDSDRDGMPDYMDKEPYSYIGAPVDADGVMLDSDKDGVPDYKDKEPRTAKGLLIDANGIGFDPNAGGEVDLNLGMVFFDFNRSAIKDKYMPDIYNVAAYMKRNPTKSIYVKGFADNRGTNDYNIGIAQKRADKVADYLSQNFNIAKERFTIQVMGEDQTLVDGLPDRRGVSEKGHALNRRVEFEIIK